MEFVKKYGFFNVCGAFISTFRHRKYLYNKESVAKFFLNYLEEHKKVKKGAKHV